MLLTTSGIARIVSVMTTYRGNTHRPPRRPWRTRLAAWWDWWRPGVIATLVIAAGFAVMHALALLGAI